jgi:cytochrome c553
MVSRRDGTDHSDTNEQHGKNQQRHEPMQRAGKSGKSGVLHAAPYLAGQSSEYISSALKAFHAGSRKNDAGELMRSVAGHLADADIAAASAYFANEGSATRP